MERDGDQKVAGEKGRGEGKEEGEEEQDQI